MPTDKILITNDAGEQVEATAPVIISACLLYTSDAADEL